MIDEKIITPAVLGAADAADIALAIIAKAPDVSGNAADIEKQIGATLTPSGPAPYGYLKNGKPRKTPPSSARPAPTSLLPDDRYAGRLESATAIIDTLTGTLGAIFDPDEWKPTEAEHKTLTGATARYMESRNLDDLPPGVALVIAAALYAIPRLVAREKTRGKMSSFFEWARKLWTKK